MAGQQGQRQHGDHLHKADEPQIERIAGPLVNLPDDRGGLHLHAEDRHDVANPVAPEIRPANGRIGIVSRGGHIFGRGVGGVRIHYEGKDYPKTADVRAKRGSAWIVQIGAVVCDIIAPRDASD